MTHVFLISGLSILIYGFTARFAILRLDGLWREVAFAVLNVIGIYWFFFRGQDRLGLLIFSAYLALALLQYLMLLVFSEKPNGLAWFAFFTPIAALIVIRYVPASCFSGLINSLWMSARTDPDFKFAPHFVGISYLAFRCSRLVLEVRNGVVKKPNVWEYLGFCFFLPTMFVGPINSYSNYRRGFAVARPEIPCGRALSRIIVGFVKYQFLGNIFNQLTYSGLLLDDHPHRWMDLPVAMVFYYLFLYCNFSGFCDMAIGAAGLIGVPVPENFDNPLAARNMRDLWNRWHITLSTWMRDLVFSPLSKFLVRVMGVNLANHAVALAILVTFLLIGIWHGAGWNYAAFGVAQAFGVAVTHYYTIWLKKRLGRDGFRAYNSNRWIHAVAVTVTFCYYAATLFLFANTFPQIKEIFSLLR
jgi:D-alanyl-lipoteichoic acid acyltransferase DltB (MBOAT superfamily)